MNTYKLTLTHDKGKTKVRVMAETLDKAISQVCEAEGCPPCAVTHNIRTIDKIVYPVNCKYGAPMGRPNVGEKPTDKRIFDCAVPMSDGCYDKGGAYWGMGAQLRVSYTKDLSYINFYRAKH